MAQSTHVVTRYIFRYFVFLPFSGGGGGRRSNRIRTSSKKKSITALCVPVRFNGPSKRRFLRFFRSSFCLQFFFGTHTTRQYAPEILFNFVRNDGCTTNQSHQNRLKENKQKQTFPRTYAHASKCDGLTSVAFLSFFSLTFIYFEHSASVCFF